MRDKAVTSVKAAVNNKSLFVKYPTTQIKRCDKTTSIKETLARWLDILIQGTLLLKKLNIFQHHKIIGNATDRAIVLYFEINAFKAYLPQ